MAGPRKMWAALPAAQAVLMARGGGLGTTKQGVESDGSDVRESTSRVRAANTDGVDASTPNTWRTCVHVAEASAPLALYWVHSSRVSVRTAQELCDGLWGA